MAATKQKKQQKNGKALKSEAHVEQLSATSESETENQCEDLIREKAYLLWEAAGYPAGDGTNFWLQAEQALSETDD